MTKIAKDVSTIFKEIHKLGTPTKSGKMGQSQLKIKKLGEG